MSQGQAKWDIRFLRLASREVAQWSKDPNKQVGCIIVSPDRRRVTFGYNGLPQGVADTDERLGDVEVKNRLSVHAELNAILNARTDLTGWTLYVTEPPCVDCAKAIIQAGVARVVCPSGDPTSKWYASQEEARGVLMEAGVRGASIMREKFE